MPNLDRVDEAGFGVPLLCKVGFRVLGFEMSSMKMRSHLWFQVSWMVCLVSLGWLSPSVEAQLSWEQTEVLVEPGIEEKRVETSFRFTNTGDYPLTIRSAYPKKRDLKVVRLEKKTYWPGESGELKVSYGLRAPQPDFVRQIEVVTDEAENATQALVLHVDLPEYLKVTPRMARWFVNRDAEEVAELKPKVIDIKAVKRNQELEILKIVSRSRVFKTELKTIKAGEHYQLIMHPPVAEARRQNGVVELYTNLPVFEGRPIRVYGSVKRLSEEIFRAQEAREAEASQKAASGELQDGDAGR